MSKRITKSAMHTCFHCAKIIKGQMVYVRPPLYAKRMGDFERAYHPKCYEASEKEAAKELGIK